MDRLKIVDLDNRSIKQAVDLNNQSKQIETRNNEALIVSLNGEDVTELRADCVDNFLTINVADRPFKVWRGTGEKRELVLEGYGPGSEEFDTSDGVYEVTIETKETK